MNGAVDIQRLSATHRRAGFSCGVPQLDRYFREQAAQDMRRGVANCFVAVDDGGTVLGYFSLSASSMLLFDLPTEIARRLPRYPVVPTALIGRLAVAQACQGRGLGGSLLFDAMARARQSDAAVFAVTVDAKDDRAEAFYARYGFRSLTTIARRLYLPVTVAMVAP